ncbi:hypothetical protein CC86DRAFT_84965 [Ophiobolus disseminans]|uniref:Uncharacterized protein n=1 Tax=Ophiobolus disseminans TaxID=1469910 RepID=A0A6A7AFL8_9PLEO|nr:hypothetical protein CC86DRAFT_84965 [Ophiobolus disseminans]
MSLHLSQDSTMRSRVDWPIREALITLISRPMIRRCIIDKPLAADPCSMNASFWTVSLMLTELHLTICLYLAYISKTPKVSEF